jgi:hypothetical protein
VVTLLSAVATALLGLLARDPGSESSSTASNAKLGAWMLVAVLLLGTIPLAGCSGTTVAEDIVNWTPALQSAVATVDSTAALLAPEDAPIFAAATVGFDAASNLLVGQCKAYLANPSAALLAELQTQITAFVQQTNAALLNAGRIANPVSQQHALAVIQAVSTIAMSMMALVQSVSSNAAVARMASQSTIKLAEVRRYMDEGKAAEMVASHYGEPVVLARIELARAEVSEAQAGF